MAILLSARSRVLSALEQVDQLKDLEFPYAFPRDAIELIGQRFLWYKNVLAKASTASQATQNVCRDVLRELNVYVPVLGFLLRATNVRNGFEAHGGLQRMARALMGPDTKLVLSSEWEFSPYVYRAITGLEGFVLIGLPATESSNPLLLPLAGHELGHAVWQYHGTLAKYATQIEEFILDQVLNIRWSEYNGLYPQHSKKDVKSGDMFARATIQPAYTWATLQLEEVFCDLFGLRVFDVAYYHAFAYLLSPGVSGQRSLAYPTIKRRVAYLTQAGKAFGITAPQDFESLFIAESEPADRTTAFLVSIADAASASLVDAVVAEARDRASAAGLPQLKSTAVASICRCFREWIVPVTEYANMIDIVNAGWECYYQDDLWETVPQIQGRNATDFSVNRRRVLRDLVLKSMEIAEIHQRLEASA